MGGAQDAATRVRTPPSHVVETAGWYQSRTERNLGRIKGTRRDAYRLRPKNEASLHAYSTALPS